MALDAVHLIGLFVVTGGIVAGAVALVRGAIRGRVDGGVEAAWRLDDLLVLGCSPTSSSSWLTTSNDPGFLRYLTAAVIFGAVLAGDGWGASPRRSRPRDREEGRSGRRLAVVAALAAAFGFTLAGPTPTSR